MKTFLLTMLTASVALCADAPEKPVSPAPKPAVPAQPKELVNVHATVSDACSVFDDGHIQCALPSLASTGQPPIVYLTQDGNLTVIANGRVVSEMSQRGFSVYSDSYQVSQAESAVIRALLGVVKAQSEDKKAK